MVPATVPENRFLIATQQGKLVAYCFFQYRPQWKAYEIRELLWVPQYEHPENLLPAFLKSILHLLDVKEIVCYIPNPVFRLLSLKPDVLPLKEMREDRTSHYLLFRKEVTLESIRSAPPPNSSRYTLNAHPLDWHVFFRVDSY